MSEIKNEHPYLDGEEEEQLQGRILWNTNPGFPVSVLLEKEIAETSIQEKKKKSKASHAATPVQKPFQADDGPEMLSSFSQWLLSLKPSRYQGPEVPPGQPLTVDSPSEQQGIEPEKKKKKKKKKKKEARLKELQGGKGEAHLEKDMVSETLAELIASQGHIDEAILMYRKLVNINPERAAYYIQKISELRQGKE